MTKQKKQSPFYDTEGLNAFFKSIKKHIKSSVEAIEVDGHINDEVFMQAVLNVSDDWVTKGIIQK